MRKFQDFKWLAAGLALVALTGCDGQKWSEQQVDSFMLVTQKGGPTLGYSPQSGVKLLTVDVLPTSLPSSPSRRLPD